MPAGEVPVIPEGATEVAPSVPEAPVAEAAPPVPEAPVAEAAPPVPETVEGS